MRWRRQEETVLVNGFQVAGLEDLSDGRDIHRLSIRLDPALYTNHSIEVQITAPGIDGVIVNKISLYDIDYRYADAGGSEEVQYPGDQRYGWLNGTANTTYGTLPYQSSRINLAGNEVRYRLPIT